MNKPKIGVFDSGVGGLSVVKAIESALPMAEVIFVHDNKNVPYGNKSPEELYGLVLPILNMLSKQGCDVIVIACNTVTTTIVKWLRKEISVPIIGMEPMVKPAAEKTKSGIIAVCATPATLASKRYRWLKNNYAKNLKIIEPDCSKWSYLIETKQIDRRHIEKQIIDVCESAADIIVLGCTHFHWIEGIIRQIAQSYAEVLQPEKPVILQLKRIVNNI